MNNIEFEPSSSPVQIKNEHRTQKNEQESVEHFQQFIFELFEKNGVLSDLRAYLRRHIVTVLRNAYGGETPACQKHFAQRLELTSQACNMLIAEYLLSYEFSYSSSVFVSEIPLANMAFDFASNLMKGDNENIKLKFNEKDVCTVLNYLGIKCSSDFVSEVIDMYRKADTPLLLCILKCYNILEHEPVCGEESISSAGQNTTSTETLSEKPSKKQDRCRHAEMCRSCSSKLKRLRKKCKKNRKAFVKRETSMNSMKVKSLLKKITSVEGNLVDELFKQLRSVYETEVDMVRAEEEDKVKRSLATHVLQLQQEKHLMEEQFKAREQELERNMQEKKKFLWGLARSLRDQHDQMSRAMRAVRYQAQKLTTKEDSLRTQLLEAEQCLKKRGEGLQHEISSELMMLEKNYAKMKEERDILYRERSELEQLKLQCSTGTSESKIVATDPEFHGNYLTLTREIEQLKKYVEAARQETKCLVNRGTITVLSGVSSRMNLELLNNEQIVQAREDDKLKNQVVNDFKKLKNINFCMGNMDDTPPVSRREGGELPQRSHGDHALREARRRAHVRVQEPATPALSALEASRLRLSLCAETPSLCALRPAACPARTQRPHTAPAATHNGYEHSAFSLNISGSSNSFGWRAGGGETELASRLPPRGAPLTPPAALQTPPDDVIAPPVPSLPPPAPVNISTPPSTDVKARHADLRRHLIHQWRTARHLSPRRRSRAKSGPSVSPQRMSLISDRIASYVASIPKSGLGTDPSPPTSMPSDEQQISYQPSQITPTKNSSTPIEKPRPHQRQRDVISPDKKLREQSPKSMLREAKEKLRTKANMKYSTPTTSNREKSPNAVLREAKMRLRKLEIEAEAVEKSYLDFRKRQFQFRSNLPPVNDEAIVTRDYEELTIRRSRPLQKIDQTYPQETKADLALTQQLIREDFDKYLRDYHAKFDLSETYFANRNTMGAAVSPIPQAYAPYPEPNNDINENHNYLDAPIEDFRKHYQTQSSSLKSKLADNTVSEVQNVSQNNKDTPPSPFQKKVGTVEANITHKQMKQNELEAKKEALIKESIEKQMEFKILKCNIHKMYNMEKDLFEKRPEIPKEGENGERSQIVKIADENVLRIEVENTNEMNSIQVVKSQPEDLLVVVQSSVNAAASHSETDDEYQKMSGNMTIIISPKRSRNIDGDRARSKSPEKSRSSPEQAARLTRNDVLEAIFHADTAKVNSNMEIHEYSSKDPIDESTSEVDYMGPDDYHDDFFADVDNYNTLTDIHSPISLPKSPPEEAFWDS